jgi:hypothetical protein
MRRLACGLCLLGMLLQGCRESNEQKLRLALNIDGNYAFAIGEETFEMERYKIRYNEGELEVYGDDGRLLATVREDSPCVISIVYSVMQGLRPTIRTIDFNKLNMNAPQYFDARAVGYGAIRIPGTAGALTNNRGDRHSELLISSFRAGDRQIYFDRISAMRNEFCKGRS